MEVTLLSKKEVKGKSKILEKVGIYCNSSYWTRSQLFNGAYNCYAGFYVTAVGVLDGAGVSNIIGVRPVIKSDNLEKLIKNLKITYENGVEVVEYGQYPDLEVQLDIPNNASLKPTGKKYYYNYGEGKFCLEEYLEYEFDGEKYVNIEDKYYKVKPVKFYVDRENSMLISKNVLFDAPINIMKDNPNYNGKFETSQLYQFLNNEFIKALKPDKKYTNDDIETLFEEENPYNLDLKNVDEEDIINVKIKSHKYVKVKKS